MELTSFSEIFWAVEVWTIIVVSSIYFLASFMYFRGFMFRPHAFLVPIIFVLFGAGYTFVSVGMMAVPVAGMYSSAGWVMNTTDLIFFTTIFSITILVFSLGRKSNIKFM